MIPKCPLCPVVGPTLCIDQRTGHEHFCRRLAERPDLAADVVRLSVEAERAAAGQPEPPLPSLPRQVANYAAARFHHTLAGSPVAPPEVVARRLAVCSTGAGLGPDQVAGGHCNAFRPSDRRCGGSGGCGCFVEIKATWADAACPLGRWSS
jgi:hypothetical protein